MPELLNVVLMIAVTLGLFAACLAFYGRYYILPALFTGPTICRLEAGGCQILFRTKEAALLGVPNSLLGILFYPSLAVAAALHLPTWLLFLASSASFLMTLYLARLLISRGLECRICWAGHAANALIWVVLLLRLFLDGAGK